jgi:hypothetical protein
LEKELSIDEMKLALVGFLAGMNDDAIRSIYFDLLRRLQKGPGKTEVRINMSMN